MSVDEDLARLEHRRTATTRSRARTHGHVLGQIALRWRFCVAALAMRPQHEESVGAVTGEGGMSG